MLAYPIGSLGQPWGEAEKASWQNATEIQRSYQSLVVDRVFALSGRFSVAVYGALSHDPLRYPLYALETLSPDPELPWVLVTGGVHGYETSGVLGALSFLERSAQSYQNHFNFLVLPCISPWGFETINRWNIATIDPNRSFKEDGLCEEARFVIRFLACMQREFIMHIDLHETTDTDESEFRPALAAKLGQRYEPTEIPDGFYLVGDANNPQSSFQAAIVSAVGEITHIAPNDAKGRLLGDIAAQRGVVNYAYRSLGLCAGVTNAPYTTTTEVYPDSASITPDECIDAQVCALEAGLTFISSVDALED